MCGSSCFLRICQKYGHRDQQQGGEIMVSVAVAHPAIPFTLAGKTGNQERTKSRTPERTKN
jgi:hypothetical protein